jgi:3-methylcrotonyl-CoA carboxylase alpha subunit
MFERILIANRGEIACRIARTCRKLGVSPVAVYSEADARARHVQLADAAYLIGGPRPADSYLRGDAVIAAALRAGAQAIHPGYGFLSENADFADAVESAGLVFIGPRAASMRKMGSKAGAKELMSAAGVPVVPGYTGVDQDPAKLVAEAKRVGFPLMIKAAHGGGGKGMRIVRSADEFLPALESCQREAKNAFGRDRVLLERYIEKPRHVEFQVFADTLGNTIHLNERECSAQRRYQKVIEETPSPFLTPERRAAMGDAAVAAARAIDYVNAGTVEFIVAQDGGFYFMEINTRLQVEHPVTEMVLGVDLVEWQLRVASGEPLPLRQSDVRATGHAVEVRIYAEDPENNFLPGSGRLDVLALPPAGDGVRVDGGVAQGDLVSIFYDPMIAKLIAYGHDRDAAYARLRAALAETEIVGPRSNVEFLEKLVRHPVVVEGRIDTSYLDTHLEEVLPAHAGLAPEWLFAASALALLDEEAAAQRRTRASGDPFSPWGRADAWRVAHQGKRIESLGYRGERHEVAAHGHDGEYRFDFGAHRVRVSARWQEPWLTVDLDGTTRRFRARIDHARVLLHDGERRVVLDRLRAFARAGRDAHSGDRILAPMPGRVVAVRVAAGDVVASGQELLVMEAMKMEIALKSPRDGTIEAVGAAVGDFVEADAQLARLASLSA